MKNNVLILGNGLLGSELHDVSNWDVLSREKNDIDITQKSELYAILKDRVAVKKYDTVINCIANTNTYSNDKRSHLEVNSGGVYNLITICNSLGIKLVHISTDFVYVNCDVKYPSEESVPVHAENWYSYSKLLADGMIELLSNDYLILRASHKKNPFPFETAYSNVYGNFDYVDVIAKQIYTLVVNDASGIYNIGTELKSFYELAKRTNTEVKPTETVDTIKNRVYSIDKFKKFIKDNPSNE